MDWYIDMNFTFSVEKSFRGNFCGTGALSAVLSAVSILWDGLTFLCTGHEAGELPAARPGGLAFL